MTLLGNLTFVKTECYTMYFYIIINYRMLENTKVDIRDSRNQDAEREKSVLTITQTAGFLQVSLPTLYRWAKSGTLKPIKVEGRVYYRMRDVDALFNREKGNAN